MDQDIINETIEKNCDEWAIATAKKPTELIEKELKDAMIFSLRSKVSLEKMESILVEAYTIIKDNAPKTPIVEIIETFLGKKAVFKEKKPKEQSVIMHPEDYHKKNIIEGRI